MYQQFLLRLRNNPGHVFDRSISYKTQKSIQISVTIYKCYRQPTSVPLSSIPHPSPPSPSYHPLLRPVASFPPTPLAAPTNRHCSSSSSRQPARAGEGLIEIFSGRNIQIIEVTHAYLCIFVLFYEYFFIIGLRFNYQH